MCEKTNVDVLELFSRSPRPLKVSAPMVRYSKLQFRNLVHLYGCDLSFTPMIIADSFKMSEAARRNEFSTNASDTPVIVQFAANNVGDFVGGAYLVSPYSSGADLNCGCPQRWAREQGLGCALLDDPEKIYDMVRQCRNRIPGPFTVSVKMRLSDDIGRTVELCRRLEHAHVSFLTIHARLPHQAPSTPPDLAALKTVKESLGAMPMVANGGATDFDSLSRMYRATGCEGVMVAGRLLANPTLFVGSSRRTTRDCVADWVDLCCANDGRTVTFRCFHHHLVFMMDGLVSKAKKCMFDRLKTFEEVLDFLSSELCIEPRSLSEERSLRYAETPLEYASRLGIYEEFKLDEEEEVRSDFDEIIPADWFDSKTESLDVGVIDREVGTDGKFFVRWIEEEWPP